MRFHDKNFTNPEIFMKWFIYVYIQLLQYETEKNGVFTRFTTQIPNSMKFEFECLNF